MKHRAGGLLTAIFGLLAACSTGPMDVRLEPPAVKVDSLRIENGRVHLGLHMHNRNDHELLLQSAAIAMRVNDIELLDSVRALELDISPRGRELVHLDAPALPGGAQLLTGLETSPGASIEFELSSDITIDGQKNATSVEQGFLFPVPGQPGHFR
jgi:hypothetical protein